ncbi:hypothetical protein [Bdellovibrio sp. HCB337]|uniref:hypothetical protein n=1 Tax=Bdellovibrio sp. HCB337 TaxID=3394358 RepID=UPI0039A63B14
MNIKALILIAWVLLGLTACNNGEKPMTARTGTNGQKPDNGSQKPDPTPAKLVEKVAALQLQKPTQVESEFLNVMDIEFGDADRAVYSFKYAPGDNGSLFFSLAQVRLLLKECTKDANRTVTARIFWQEVKQGKRSIIDVLKDSVEEFEYRAQDEYILSYVLMDLKKELSDCKSATLKFASFPKKF